MPTWLSKFRNSFGAGSRRRLALKHQGDAHLGLDQLDDAAHFYQRALAIDPDYVDARVGLGYVLLRQGRSVEAMDHLNHALSIDPEVADAHYLMGTATKHHADLEPSIAHFTRALNCNPRFEDAYRELYLALCRTNAYSRAKATLEAATNAFPGSSEFHCYLGSLLANEGDFQSAITHYETALSITPDAADVHKLLGDALIKRGDADRALACYSKVVSLRPDQIDSHISIGTILQQRGEADAAIASFTRAVALGPDHVLAHHHLGNAYLERGMKDKAIASFRRVIELDPGNGVQHLVHALAGNDSERAPIHYVEKLFDDYADRFDSHLVQRLKYDMPAQLAALLGPYAGGGTKWVVLDLGCGTGLSGAAVAPYARQLVGVDLSAQMLLKAKERGIYHRLEQLDLQPMLEGEATAAYDLVMAADVFVYLGKLDASFREVARLLRPEGLFAFSVEALDASTDTLGDRDTGQEYRLRPTGRYAHSSSYIRRLASENGLEVAALIEARGRIDHGHPVRGYAVVLSTRGVPRTDVH